MKSTGIVRRIDDLGRVVIPKEVRRTLRIREGDPLEIFTSKEGEVILRKYCPFSNIEGVSKQMIEVLRKQISTHKVLICSNDKIIVSRFRDLPEEKPISNELFNCFNSRGFSLQSMVEISEGHTADCFIVQPIIVEGDVLGGIVVIIDNKDDCTDKIKTILSTVASMFQEVMGE